MMNTNRRASLARLKSVAACLVLAYVVSAARAESPAWPQWGGPHRNFKSQTKGLADSWPEAGPKKLWQRDLGDGYSSIVSDGKTLYTMYSIRTKDEKGKFAMEGQEAVVALDPKTGKTKWEYKYDAPWTKELQMEFGPGPHSTPLIAGDKLIAVGCTAKLSCLDAESGKVLWKHDLAEEYKVDLGGRGYGSSPFAYKGTVLLPIGGKGQGVVAWKIEDGSVAWKNGDFDVTYASIFQIKLGDEQQLVVFSGKEVVGIDPATGEKKWGHPHPTQYGANISTPVWNEKDRRLFISSAYGQGSRGLELSCEGGKSEVKELWYNKKMKIHFGNALRVGDVVYGSSGDFGPCFFCAVDIKTGDLIWQQRGIKKASCLYADGKMLILDEDGNLILSRVSKEGYEELARTQICDKNAWTVPTLVGKTLYVRDRKSVMALDLG